MPAILGNSKWPGQGHYCWVNIGAQRNKYIMGAKCIMCFSEVIFKISNDCLCASVWLGVCMCKCVCGCVCVYVDGTDTHHRLRAVSQFFFQGGNPDVV